MAKKKASRKKSTARRAPANPAAAEKATTKKATTKKAPVKKRGTPHPERARLLKFALTLPEAWEDHPWGESVAKVKKKVFVFFGVEADGHLLVCVKLPSSGAAALRRPEVEPAGYGLGKSGWVVAKYDRGDEVDVDELRDWIVESYCAVAPKKLAALVDE